MTNVDQFESLFRASIREVYRYEPPKIERILQVTDLDSRAEGAASAWAELRTRARSFLHVLGDDPEWIEIGPSDFDSVSDLLQIVEREEPDLVCTYRNLKSNAWRWPYSLGEYVDVLTQVATCPVLVVPHPEAGRAFDHALENTDTVMAVTNHLAGDAKLVNYAVHFTQAGGTLYLAHIEDQAAFERTLDVISKIPSIDTEAAREAIAARLVKEPRDYVDSIRTTLDAAKLQLRTESLVAMGNPLREYERMVAEHEVDLLVFQTKDQGQLAMHGLAHSIAVELREIPLLML